MKTSEAKKHLKELLSNDIKNHYPLEEAKKRLRQCDPNMDISQIIYLSNQRRFYDAGAVLIEQLLTQNMIKFLTDPIVEELQQTISKKVVYTIFQNS